MAISSARTKAPRRKDKARDLCVDRGGMGRGVIETRASKKKAIWNELQLVASPLTSSFLSLLFI